MDILIVGGLGYLGPVIAKTIKSLLQPNGLYALDTGWFTSAALGVFSDSYDEIFYQDKRNISVEFLKKFDVVIDLAAVSNDPMGADFELVTEEINCLAAVELAQKAKKAGVKRFIFASSCSIYGAAGDSKRNENDEKNPLTAYARSKWHGEQGLEKIVDDNFSVIALRFATACGWSPTFRADLVLNDFVLTALIEKEIIVLSDGTPWRPLIHVKDIGRAVAWASQVNSDGFQAFNVGSNFWTLTIKELAANVSNILEVPYQIMGQGNNDKRSYRVCFDKFEKMAHGWLPQEEVNSAVCEIKNHLQHHLKSINDFRNGPLIRLNILRKKIKSNELNLRLELVKKEMETTL